MAFDWILGQYRVKQILEASMNRNRLAQAYLFHGQPGVGKDAIAISMAMGLNCNQGVIGGCRVCPSCSSILKLEHPAFRIVLPVPTRPKSIKQERYREIIRERVLQRVENPYREVSYNPEMTLIPLIGIDQVRALKREVMLKIAGKGQRVFLISHAEQMTQSAANSLLKLLEEPPDKTFLFLTTSIPGRLLPTIISRCQSILFDFLQDEEIEDGLMKMLNIKREKARLIAKVAGGSLQNAFDLVIGGFEQQREEAVKFLDISLEGDSLKCVDGIEDLLKKRDKIEIKKILKILLMWLRDIFYFSLGYSQTIMNIDRIEQLKKFSVKWSGFDAEAGIRSIEQAIDLFEKNVYLKLIIFNLSKELKKCKRQ